MMSSAVGGCSSLPAKLGCAGHLWWSSSRGGGAGTHERTFAGPTCRATRRFTSEAQGRKRRRKRSFTSRKACRWAPAKSGSGVTGPQPNARLMWSAFAAAANGSACCGNSVARRQTRRANSGGQQFRIVPGIAAAVQRPTASSTWKVPERRRGLTVGPKAFMWGVSRWALSASIESHFSSIHIVRSPKRCGFSQSVSASFRRVYC